ncbi:hypothetical protein H5410_025742 [Solanum commersonii]|uniref:BHLH domain-containing protein n=1 Tax=Solanum commersonii TaxID=4109 RepID=A0A9J5YV28_SOLCO|nr:hypothetical protein H5410_025742 [Solanum commersonii]
MDPQASMMNHAGGFRSPPFNLSEIWQFPINAGEGETPYSFPSSAAPAAQNVSDVRNNDPMVLDRRTTNYSGGGGGSARKRNEDDESAKGVSSSGNGLTESASKRMKVTRSNENCESRGDGEGNSWKSAEQPAKPAEPPKDYIHVRARRGQATDSHSLAERARREKISERMKVLQDIVPGCNKSSEPRNVSKATGFHHINVDGKVEIQTSLFMIYNTKEKKAQCLECYSSWFGVAVWVIWEEKNKRAFEGVEMSFAQLKSNLPSLIFFWNTHVIGKALVLDEIINYIQSLQHQVEFLSRKLEAVNSKMPSIEGYPSKDFGQQPFDTNAMTFSSQATTEYARGTSPDWLHMQLGGGFERTT